MRRGHKARRAAAGYTLVEMMIGVAIGLFIVAAGSTLAVGALRENRALLIEARLLQDLRTAADVVSHDLRRSGYWGNAASGVWLAGAAGVVANPYAAFTPGSAASDAASFRYSRDAVENNAVDSNEQFGFRLRSGVIELQLGSGNWQALTDAGTLTVLQFVLTPRVQEASLESACAKACSGAVATCPPRRLVRSVEVQITARASTDATVVRSLLAGVRLRNDVQVGACEV